MAPRRRSTADVEFGNDESMMRSMFAAFRQMAARARLEDSDVGRRHAYFKEFWRASVLTFDGNGDPQLAEYWLDSIVKHLDTLGVPEEYRVEFAVYKLEGGTNTWWKQAKRLERGGDISWDRFEELFYDRYHHRAGIGA